MPRDDMQAVFAAIHIEEIAAAQREGGLAALRNKVAALTDGSGTPFATRSSNSSTPDRIRPQGQ